MPKLKVAPIAVKEDGTQVGRVCEGTLKGEDMTGQYVITTPSITTPTKEMSEKTHQGFVSEATDGHLLIDIVEPGQSMEVEDQSSDAPRSGPSRANSNAFRNGWERTFSN
jgi:hypothetical protein